MGEAVTDPHAEGYRVDMETDPLRAAAHLIASFVATDLLMPHNKPYTLLALAGDPSMLLSDTRTALKWIRAQIERDPETVINAWTAHLMEALGEWPESTL